MSSGKWPVTSEQSGADKFFLELWFVLIKCYCAPGSPLAGDPANPEVMEQMALMQAVCSIKKAFAIESSTAPFNYS